MDASDLKKLQEMVEKSDLDLTAAIAARDADIAKLGVVSKSIETRVARSEEAVLAANTELKALLAEETKKGVTLGEEVTDALRRVAEVEKRLGRSGPQSMGSDRGVVKSIGQRFVEAMTSDQYRTVFEALKGGHNGGPSVFFDGPEYNNQINAALALRSMGIPVTVDTLANAIAQKATVSLTDATRLSAPFRDSQMAAIRPMHSIRDFMNTRPISVASAEYIETLGMGPETGTAVTSLTSSGTTATLTIAGGHGLKKNEVFEISGANEAGYNGVWRANTITSATVLTFILATDPDNTATGTILFRDMSRYGAAAPVAEGGTKPEARLKFDLKTALVQVIAHWIPATRQVLDDLPELQAMIDSDLSFGLEDAVERQILYGSGVSPNLPGILTHANRQTLAQGSLTPLNALRRAITYIQLAKMVPNVMAMNALDWDGFETATSVADNHYLLVGGAAGSDQKVWRVPVHISNSIIPKTVLVGAFDQGATLYDRQKASVRFSEHHASYFTSNLLAILAELRIGVAWKRPEAFVDLTLT